MLKVGPKVFGLIFNVKLASYDINFSISYIYIISFVAPMPQEERKCILVFVETNVNQKSLEIMREWVQTQTPTMPSCQLQ